MRAHVLCQHSKMVPVDPAIGGAKMHFELTDEQAMFRDAVAGFAQSNLAAGAVERAHQEDYPWDVARMMAEQGLLGITIGEEKGGIGGSLMDAVIAIEQIAAVCPRS